MIVELEALESRWSALEGTAHARILPWARGLFGAARQSIACGLESQARALLERLEKRLPASTGLIARLELTASWNSAGLVKEPSIRREEAQWRRIRSLRASRRPYDGAQHPGKQGLAWGPYNRASAVIEALEAAAGVDALWVDDILERERACGAIDALLGIPPA